MSWNIRPYPPRPTGGLPEIKINIPMPPCKPPRDNNSCFIVIDCGFGEYENVAVFEMESDADEFIKTHNPQYADHCWQKEKIYLVRSAK